MSGKIILLIMKSILLIMKIILRIVGLETGYAERIRKCQEKVHVYERLCLEGTTERSDGNRGRSPRIVNARTRCLEGTTP